MWLAARVGGCFGRRLGYFIYVRLYTPGDQGRCCSISRETIRKGIHIWCIRQYLAPLGFGRDIGMFYSVYLEGAVVRRKV